MMNFTLQKQIIGKRLNNMGISPDLIDLDAHIDRTLTLEENSNIILADAKFLCGPSKGLFGSGRYSNLERMQQAREHNNNRTFESRQLDNRLQARTVFESQDLNQKNYNKWKKRPNRYDISGIDGKYGGFF